MKSHTNIIVLFFVIIFLGQPLYAQNLIPNSGFELDAYAPLGKPDYFHSRSSTDAYHLLETNVANVYEGNACALFDNTSGSDAVCYYYAFYSADGGTALLPDADSGCEYELSVKYKTDSAFTGAGIALQILFYSAGEQVGAYWSEYYTSTDWKTLKLTATAVGGELEIRVGVYYLGQGKAWVDNLELVKTSLHKNGSFETDAVSPFDKPDFWYGRTSTIAYHHIETDPGLVYDGAKCVLFNNDSGSNLACYFYGPYEANGSTKDWIQVCPGDSYEISAFGRVDSNFSGNGIKIGLMFWDNNLSFVSRYDCAYSTPSEWTKFVKDAVVPAGAALMSYAVDYSGQNKAWIDEFRLNQKNLAKNSCFETDNTLPIDYPDFWQVRSYTKDYHHVETDTNLVYEGNQCALFNNDSGSAQACYFYGPATAGGSLTKINVRPKEEYQISAFAKTGMDFTGTGVKVSLLFWNQDNFVSRSDSACQILPDWTQISTTAVVPDGVSQMTYSVEYVGKNKAWFDKVEVFKIANDIAGNWLLDDGTGTTAADSSGNSNHGTLVNMDTNPESPGFCWVDGKSIKALLFDGINDFVNCGNDGSLDITDELTISCWIFPTSTPAAMKQIVSKWSGSWAGSPYVLDFRSTNKIRFSIAGNNIESNAISLNKWSHIVATYSKSAGEMKLYINAGTPVSAGYSASLPVTTAPVTIGALAYNNLGYCFAGSIDDVRIYNYAFSSDDVRQEYLSVKLELPIVFDPNKTLEDKYGYTPEYPTGGLPGFDSMNRPYIRASSFVATLRNGLWEERNFLNFITNVYPDFNSTYHADGFFNDTQVVFDVDDNAYTILTVKLNDGSVKDLLLFSTDYCMTWSVHELPGTNSISYNGHAYEHPFSANASLQGPPPVLRFIKRADFPSGWHESYYSYGQAYYYIYLVQPWINNGELVMPGEQDMVEITDSYIGPALHSGGASYSVTKNGKTHIVWPEVQIPNNPPNIEAVDNATPVYIRTYDHQTQTLSQPVYLFSTESSFGISDSHNSPGICIDSAGYLHVIAAGHNRPCVYTKSLVSNNANSGWTTPIEINTGMPTYLGFVCDYDDTLHIIYRNYYYAAQNYYSLCYQRKQDASSWEPVQKLTMPAYPGYAGYYHKMAIDKLNNLFIASPGYYSAEEPLLNTDYSFLLISSPEYPWVFTMTPHFEIIGE